MLFWGGDTLFDLTVPYYFILNTFEKVWNWLITHYIVIDEYRANYIEIACFLLFVRFIIWVFPFFGDDDFDD